MRRRTSARVPSVTIAVLALAFGVGRRLGIRRLPHLDPFALPPDSPTPADEEFGQDAAISTGREEMAATGPSLARTVTALQIHIRSRQRWVVALAVATAVLYLVVMQAQSSILSAGFRSPNPALTRPQLAAPLVVYCGATAVLFVLYGAAVLACSKSADRRVVATLLVAPVVVQLGLLAFPPTFSVDVFSYVAHGATGLAPLNGDAYSVLPMQVTKLSIGQELLRAGWNPAPATSPYGPVWTLIENLVVGLPVGVAIQVVLFKAIALVTTIGSASLIWRILGRIRPDDQLLGTVLFLWNPVVIVELAGEGHNDGVMVFFALLGIYATTRAWAARGLVGTALGTLVKYLPAFFAPAQVVYLWRTSRNRRHVIVGLVIGALGSALIAAASYAPFLGSGPLSAIGISSAGGPWPVWPTIGGLLNNLIAAGLPTVDAGRTRSLWVGGAFALFVLIQSVRVRSAQDLVRAAASIAVVYALVVSAVYWPWYAVMPIALLTLSPSVATVALIAVLSIGSRIIGPLAGALPIDYPFANAWAIVTIGSIAAALVVFAAGGWLTRSGRWATAR